MNILKTFLTSDLSKKLNGYESANQDFEQRNLRGEWKSEPKHVNLWFAVNCLRIETFLS